MNGHCQHEINDVIDPTIQGHSAATVFAPIGISHRSRRGLSWICVYHRALIGRCSRQTKALATSTEYPSMIAGVAFHLRALAFVSVTKRALSLGSSYRPLCLPSSFSGACYWSTLYVVRSFSSHILRSGQRHTTDEYVPLAFHLLVLTNFPKA